MIMPLLSKCINIHGKRLNEFLTAIKAIVNITRRVSMNFKLIVEMLNRWNSPEKWKKWPVDYIHSEVKGMINKLSETEFELTDLDVDFLVFITKSLKKIITKELKETSLNKLGIFDYKLGAFDYKLEVFNYKLEVFNYKLEVLKYKLEVINDFESFLFYEKILYKTILF